MSRSRQVFHHSANWLRRSAAIVCLGVFLIAQLSAASANMDSIADQVLLEDSGASLIGVTGIAPGPGASSVSLTASSSDSSLMLPPSISYVSPNATATLLLAPVSGKNGTVTITIRATDNLGQFIDRAFQVTVTAVNDAPLLDLPANVVIAEDAGLQNIGLTGIGSGATNESQTLSITAVSSDTAIIPHPNIVYTSPSSTGTLQFTPVANANGSVNIVVTVQDDGGTANGGVDTQARLFTVTITPADDPPSLDSNRKLFVPVTDSRPIGANLLASSDDGGASAITYRVTSATAKGLLQNNGTTLGINDTFTQANINAGLITYTHTGGSPELDQFSFTVSDGVNAAIGPQNFIIEAVVSVSGNATPSIALPTTTSTWTEDLGRIAMDAAATIADADNDLQNGLLTISIISGASSSDSLRVMHEGTATGQVGVSGTTISYGGTAVASWAGGDGSTALRIFLNSSVTIAAAQAILRRVGYDNSNNAPSTTTRNIQAIIDDGDGGTSAPVTIAMTIQAQNDAPVISSSSTPITYIEAGSAILLDAGMSISDGDSTNFAGGVLQVSISSGGSLADRLSINNIGNGAGQIGIAGSTVSYSGTLIGSFTGGSSTTALSVTLNTNASQSAVQALLRALTFANSSDNPSTDSRQISLLISDGDGGSSSPVIIPATITGTNDAPVLNLTASVLAYNETDGMKVVDSNATLSDPDSSQFAGGLVTIAFASGADADDRLNIAHVGTGSGQIGHIGTQITYEGTLIATAGPGATASNSMIISLTAQATPQNVQAMLRQLSFQNVSSAPSAGIRVVQVSVNDGAGGTSPIATRNIQVSDTNLPPSMALNITSGTFTENDPALILAPAATLSDSDSVDFSGGNITIAIVSGSGTNDRLRLATNTSVTTDGQDLLLNGISIASWTADDNNASLLISFNSNSSPAAAEQILRRISFVNASDTPSTSTRTIQFSCDDGDGDSSPLQTMSLTVTAVNDVPSMADQLFGTIPDTALSIDLDANDADGDSLSWTILSGPGHGSLSSIDAATGICTYTPASGTTDTDTFTVQVSDGTAQSRIATITITITSPNNPSPQTISEPDRSAAAGGTWTYTIGVDTSPVGNASSPCRFQLVGAPSGAAITGTGDCTARVDWSIPNDANGHYAFGILITETTTGASSYQPILVAVVGAPGGNG